MTCGSAYLIQALARSAELELSNKDDRMVKEKMVHMEKAKTDGTPYLSPKIVKDKGVKVVKIATEAVLVDTEYEGKPTGKKPECIAKTQVDDPKEVKWQMNKATQNYMIEKYGSDSKLWIGKEINLKVASAGNTSPSVYPAECSLEKVIA